MSGLHAAMAVAAGSFLTGALVTAVWVQRHERRRDTAPAAGALTAR